MKMNEIQKIPFTGWNIPTVEGIFLSMKYAFYLMS